MYGGSIAAAHAKSALPPLKAAVGGRQTTLQLNYGNGGGEVLRFSLEKDQDLDVGYLKILLSTDPFDSSVIEQAPRETILMGATGNTPRTVASSGYSFKVAVWDEITLPILQTREASLLDSGNAKIK